VVQKSEKVGKQGRDVSMKQFGVQPPCIYLFSLCY